MTEHKRKTVKLTKLVNPWKWAFASLLGLVIAFFMFIFVKVTTPSVDQNRIVEKTEASADKYADLSVSMNKDQLEATINYYLKQKFDQVSFFTRQVCNFNGNDQDFGSQGFFYALYEACA